MQNDNEDNNDLQLGQSGGSPDHEEEPVSSIPSSEEGGMSEESIRNLLDQDETGSALDASPVAASKDLEEDEIPSMLSPEIEEDINIDPDEGFGMFRDIDEALEGEAELEVPAETLDRDDQSKIALGDPEDLEQSSRDDSSFLGSLDEGGNDEEEHAEEDEEPAKAGSVFLDDLARSDDKEEFTDTAMEDPIQAAIRTPEEYGVDTFEEGVSHEDTPWVGDKKRKTISTIKAIILVPILFVVLGGAYYFFWEGEESSNSAQPAASAPIVDTLVTPLTTELNETTQSNSGVTTIPARVEELPASATETPSANSLPAIVASTPQSSEIAPLGSEAGKALGLTLNSEGITSEQYEGLLNRMAQADVDAENLSRRLSILEGDVLQKNSQTRVAIELLVDEQRASEERLAAIQSTTETNASSIEENLSQINSISTTQESLLARLSELKAEYAEMTAASSEDIRTADQSVEGGGMGAQVSAAVSPTEPTLPDQSRSQSSMASSTREHILPNREPMAASPREQIGPDGKPISNWVILAISNHRAGIENSLTGEYMAVSSGDSIPECGTIRVNVSTQAITSVSCSTISTYF